MHAETVLLLAALAADDVAADDGRCRPLVALAAFVVACAVL